MLGACVDEPDNSDVKLRRLPHCLDMLVRCGISAIRYTIDASKVIKARDAYDLAQAVADLRAIRDAGLWCYVQWGGLPAFVSEGVPAYVPYQGWVSDPTTPPDKVQWTGPDGTKWRLATREERPYLYVPNVPHIDRSVVRAFTRACGEMFGDLADWFGNWNEPGGRVYWPPIQSPPYEEGYARLADEVLIPGAEGYRSAMPGGVATIVGPDADVESAVGFLGEIEQARKIRLVDVWAVHLYAQGPPFLGNALRRTGEFMATACKWAAGRPIWDTESWDFEIASAQEYIRFLLECDVRWPDIRAHFIYRPQQLFVDGEHAWKTKGETLVPNSGWYAMQAYIEGRTTKRRAVR